MVQELGDGDEAEADKEAEEATGVGDHAGQAHGLVPEDDHGEGLLIEVRVRLMIKLVRNV